MAAKKFFDRFSMFNLIIIAMMAALGIATKPVIVPLAHIITGPLYIPGGAVAGGFYMMWIVLGAAIVNKRGSGTIIALVQAIMVMSLGVFGTHGIMSLVTYVIPGIAVDFIFLIFNYKKYRLLSLFLAGALANISGTYMSNVVFFRLPLIPLILSLSAGALSGGLGGLIAYNIDKGLRKYEIFEEESQEV